MFKEEENEIDLTTSQAANALGISKSLVSALCREGKLPGAYKHGRSWRIPNTSIESWMKQQNSPHVQLDPRQRWENFKHHPIIFWPSVVIGSLIFVAGFAFSLIGAGADLGGARQQLIEWSLIHPFPTRRENEILVVIATFYTANEEERSVVQNEFRSALNQQVTNLNLENTRIEVDPITIPADSQQKAYERGRYHDATIIVWGDDTDFHVQTNFLNIGTPQGTYSDIVIKENERTRLALPSDYVEFINEELGPQVTFLSLFAIGWANMMSGNYEVANDAYEVSMTVLPAIYTASIEENLHVVWSGMGASKIALGQIEGAISDFSKAIKLKPNAETYTNRGIAHMLKENWGQAITDFDEALSLDPSNPDIYRNRGLAFSSLGNLHNAIQDYTHSIEIDPNYAPVLESRALLHHALQNWDEAIADYNRVVELEPENTFALNNRGLIFLKIGDKEQAIRDFNRLIYLNPADTYALVNRGVIYMQDGNLGKAINDFSHAIELDPEYTEAYNNLGLAYYNQGKLAQAITVFSRAIEIDPENVAAYSNRGLVYAEQSEYELAILDYSHVIEINPETAAAYNNRGLAYHSQGKFTQALADYRRYLELAPDAQNRSAIESLILLIEKISIP